MEIAKRKYRRGKAEVSIEPDIGWRLFSKSLRPEEIKSGIKITGDQTLGATALTMVSVMARYLCGFLCFSATLRLEVSQIAG